MAEPILKLYVWEGVLIDWNAGAMWALASSPEEARQLVLKADSCVLLRDLEKEPTVYDGPVGFALWGGG